MFKNFLKKVMRALLIPGILCLAAYLTCVIYNYWINISDLGFTLPDETLYPVKEKNKWGYINAKGEEIVPPTFFYADLFVADYTDVRLRTIWCDLIPELSMGRSAFLYRDGRISDKATPSCIFPSREEKTYFGIWRTVGKKFGYMDGHEKWVIPPKFDSAACFSEGFAAVKIQGKGWNYINEEGDYISDSFFAEWRDFSDGLAWVKSKKNGKWGAIDSNGNVVISPTFWDTPFQFSDGVASVPTDFGNWGIYDKNLKCIIADGFDFLEPFSQGMAVAHQESKKGFVNKSGQWVIPPEYSFAREFSEGLAVLCNEEGCGYIDLDGNVVIPFVFGNTFNFVEGLAQVNVVIRAGIIIDFDYIDKQGNYVYRKKS